MDIPKSLLYTENHEWALIDDDVATVGITDYAQGELGDIVFVEFPNVGDEVSKSDFCASLEAVKTVAEVFAPVSGEIVEINTILEDEPQLINSDPYEDGWIFKIKISNPEEQSQLLPADQYQALIDE